MKMNRISDIEKKSLHSAILGLCGALIAASLLSGAGLSQGDELERLLQDRSDIIQLVWYSELTPEEGERMLKEIETHPLLGEDVAWLRQAEEGMDFSYVLGMEIRELTRTSRSQLGTCYRAEILWELEERNRHVTETHQYRIRTVDETDGTTRIAEFECL